MLYLCSYIKKQGGTSVVVKRNWFYPKPNIETMWWLQIEYLIAFRC